MSPKGTHPRSPALAGHVRNRPPARGTVARPHRVERATTLDLRQVDLRRRIAAGTYLTDDKIDYVVDRLWEVLCAVPALA